MASCNGVLLNEFNEDRVMFCCPRASIPTTFFSERNIVDFSKTVLDQVDVADDCVQALVLVSTRDVAVQIHNEMTKIAETNQIKVHACVGGTSLLEEKLSLQRGAHVIVGTPGRVDHMIKLGFLLTNFLKVLVMYDSRCMFGRSFKETISSIFGAVPKDVLAGNCFCTSTLPRSQRMLEQFRDGIPVDSLNAVIYNESEQRDVQTPESGIGAGEDLQDSQDDDDEDAIDAQPLDPQRKALLLASIASLVDVNKKEVQILVVIPRQSLIEQIYEDLRVSLNNSDISVYASTEKTKIQDDNHIITAGVHVLIGTPRRVCDLIKRKVLDADHIRAVVMDTPEELFCKGFIDQTRSVVQALPDEVEVVLLSRKTFLNDLREGFGSNSNRVERPDKFLLENVRHFYIEVVRDDLNMQAKELKGTNRNELMDKKKVQFGALCDLYPIMESRKSVILCNGKKKALRLYERMISKNFTVTCLAGRMKRTKQEEELERFESASSGVAIITEDRADYFRDKQISIVVNYDMPKRLKSYVRCVGWSGSGGDERIVVNLVGSKSAARLMETVKAAYGVPVKEISSPSDIVF
ncbi:DEAD/DEAH box helicase [Ancylostoma caninum]|uniref:RNA helicase n=1 Tax=Ancylostoma caninum TaxID=29170 RepID=A0A368FMU9_ANCCA|nr:DEAD/DEAH box helicase [Ancylostoma caninum]